MFTTGSKFLYGLGAAATVSAVAYGIASDWGSIGTVGLVSAALVLFFLGGLVAVIRDADALSLDPGLREATAAAQPAPGNSVWPVIAAIGAAITGVGLISEQRVFVVGVAVLLVALLEWMITAWAERASADGTYNRSVGKRFLDPLEHPVFAVVGLGFIIFFFSRMMLALSKTSGAVVFIVLAALILVFGAILGLMRRVSRGVVAGIVAFGFIAIGAGGMAAAVQGERDELVEAEQEEHGVRECGPEETEWDRSSMDHVSAKAGELATIYFEGGRVWAELPGLSGERESITVQRSNQSDILFVNRDPEERRLVAYLGRQAVLDASGNPVTGADGATVTQEVQTCTQLTGQDQTQFLTLKFDKPSNPEDPYVLYVAGVEGSQVEVLVP